MVACVAGSFFGVFFCVFERHPLVFLFVYGSAFAPLNLLLYEPQRKKKIKTRQLHRLIKWLLPRAGKMKQILRSDWLPKWAKRTAQVCPLGISRVVPARK